MPITPDTENELFQWAERLVNQSGRNVFLTGKAGTGKTTFLRYIREHSHKQMAVLAPTGVAAINAGGVTIHSFFQLPLSPFVPASGVDATGIADKHELIKMLKLNSEKLRVIRQLELLVIDEISMVRCDTLDAIDTVLRHVRKKPGELFGGVQLLLIGDMMQLPPVVRDEEWTILSRFYNGPYFFNSRALAEEMPVHIEFSKIYRQSEERFVKLLNQVRNNQLDEDGLALLESRYLPQFRRSPGDGFIVLTTHNEKARQINQSELSSLHGISRVYEAGIKDDFPERAFPAEQKLELKVGAQVMFIRNDPTEKGKRFYNGKIGVVSRLDKDTVFVNSGDVEIEVKPETWDNIRYSVNAQSRKLEQQLLGSFTQFPLRLAWAITIHKSQGLTFEKAIVDAGAAFAPGQVYVALSRCTNLEGLVLQTRINQASLVNDRTLVEFSERQASGGQLETEFAHAKKIFHLRLLTGLFDVHPAVIVAGDILGGLRTHQQSVNEPAIPWAESLWEKLLALQATAKKFSTQLDTLVLKDDDKSKAQLADRLAAARGYFLPELASLLRLVEFTPVVSDSYVHARNFSDDLRDLYMELGTRKRVLEKGDLMDVESIQREKRNFKSSYRPSVYAPNTDAEEETVNRELYQALKSIRDQICASEGLPVYLVASSRSLKEISRLLPQTKAELQRIPGFGAVKANRYGERFLAPVLEYTERNQLSSKVPKEAVPARKAKKKALSSKTDTRLESYLMFTSGKSIEQIATVRNLKATTIEDHLTYFVRSGQLDVTKLVAPEKIALIESVVGPEDGFLAAPVKQQLGDAVQYGEIRMVLAALQAKTDTSPGTAGE